jgi:hypothetical protein
MTLMHILVSKIVENMDQISDEVLGRFLIEKMNRWVYDIREKMIIEE